MNLSHSRFDKHCVGWCVVLTNPMDCAQPKSMSHRPWCVDDTYALGWGALTPHVTVWAKAAQHHGCGDTSKKNAQATGGKNCLRAVFAHGTFLTHLYEGI